MKIRMGFVSNSSSSSFMIYSRKELDENVLKDLFKMPEGHPLEDIGSAIASTFMSKADKVINWKSFMKKEGLEEDEALDFYSEIKEKFDEGWIVYTGYFTNENCDDAMEDYLCDTDINIKTPDLIIEHDGGF